jgi:nicotinamidase-related amidase
MVAPVLLVIDMQEAIFGDAPASQDARALDDVVARLRELRAQSWAAERPAIWVQHHGGPAHRLSPDGPGAALRADLPREARDVVVVKRECDAFHETNLAERLEALGADTLVVAGCWTDYCVDTTCRRAVSSGYDVILVADAHATATRGALTPAQVVAHHNEILDGLSAGRARLRVCSAAGVRDAVRI